MDGNKLPWPWCPLSRRREPDDDFFLDGDILCNSGFKQVPVEHDSAENTKAFDRLPEFECHISGCTQVFSTNMSYEMHYSSCHRNVCSKCRRSFPTNHLLDIHILESHDAMFHLLAAKQNMYQCLVESCKEKFSDEGKRKDHLVRHHKYPSNFRFNRQNKPRQKNKSKDTGQMEIEHNRVENKQESKQDSNKEETMDVGGPQRKFVYSVPKNICFGHGASRAFQRGSGRAKGQGHSKKKHWHQVKENKMDTSVQIENVDMNELGNALQENG